MKKTLYIHIGRPKTGSTALQGFLHSNRKALLEKGICYPETGRYQRASHKLSLVMLPGLPDHKAVEGISATDLYRDLGKEFEASGANTLAISSEHFWLLDPAQIPTLVKEQYEVRIVVYLRRQDHVLVSSFIQEVKGGSLPFTHPMADYIADPNRQRLLDYHKVLSAWGEVFGRENVIVRIFENLGEDNGIERDFLEVIGLGEKAGANLDYPEARANVSPSLDVIRILNELHELNLDPVTRRRLAQIFAKVENTLGDEGTTPASALISRVERAEILQHYAESNRALGRDFLDPDSDSPFPELEDGETAATDKAFQPETSFRLITGVVAEQQRQFVMLQNRMQRLEDQLGKQAGAVKEESGQKTPPTWRGWLARLLGR